MQYLRYIHDKKIVVNDNTRFSPDGLDNVTGARSTRLRQTYEKRSSGIF